MLTVMFQIPILVIGTKFDMAEEKQRKNQYRRLASGIAEQCGADEIFVNCHQARWVVQLYFKMWSCDTTNATLLFTNFYCPDIFLPVQ